MKQIMTVNGWKSPETLGFCQPHEHLMISKGVSSSLHDALLIDDIGKSIAEVIAYKKAGGQTIIDAQPGGCNRVAEALVEISSKAGVNIIASTGFHKHIFYPTNHWLFTKSREELQEIFVHELTAGMFTNIDNQFSSEHIPNKAGIVKVALDSCNLTPVYEKCFRAATLAAIQCDVPMMVHIEQGSDAEALLDTLIVWGANPKRIIFCHMDRKVMPLEYYRTVLDKGVTLEFDTIGRFKYHDDASEGKLVMELIDAGYEEQLLFSLDTTRARLIAYNPDGIGLTYIIKTFLPMMKAAGMNDAQIAKITHTNLMKVFC